jgi:hypothetical protein
MLIRRRLVLGQRPLSLDQRLFEWSRINLEKQITVFHCGSFFVILGDEVTGNERTDGCVDETVERSHPFLSDGLILSRDWRHKDFRWTRDCLVRFLGTARSENQAERQKVTAKTFFVGVRFGVMGNRFAMVCSVLYPVFIAP